MGLYAREIVTKGSISMVALGERAGLPFKMGTALLAAVAVIGLTQDGVASPSPSESTLDQIFQFDMLGAQVPFLERITGPAWKISGFERLYKVGGCIVGAGVRAGEVRYLELKRVSSTCKFPLREFVRNSEGFSLDSMRFGDFDKATYGSGIFRSACISLCGNAADPVVYEYWEGSRADNNMQVRIGVVIDSNAAISASSSWAETMKKTSGEDYVINTKFNCDAKYHPLAHKLFSSLQITSITVGFDLPDVSPHPCG